MVPEDVIADRGSRSSSSTCVAVRSVKCWPVLKLFHASK
ncbi:hypothetical protein ANO14919_021060 [Xylariales sp. No.14919]|nr:hypothetical protein ANO14919_021060 [Xylariales sp. No.14919]